MEGNVADVADRGDWGKVGEEVERGRDLNAVGGCMRRTGLHHEARYGNKAICEFLQLLARSANVSARDERGDQPLHVAANRSHTDICKLLVDRGADVTAVSNDGDTPLLKDAGAAAHRRGGSSAVCRPLITNDSVNVADRILCVPPCTLQQETLQSRNDCNGVPCQEYGNSEVKGTHKGEELLLSEVTDDAAALSLRLLLAACRAFSRLSPVKKKKLQLQLELLIEQGHAQKQHFLNTEKVNMALAMPDEDLTDRSVDASVKQRVLRQTARQPAFTYPGSPGGAPSTVSASPNRGSLKESSASMGGLETAVSLFTAWKQSLRFYLIGKSTLIDSIMFFFKPEHRDELIKTIENIISSRQMMLTFSTSVMSSNCIQSSKEVTTRGATLSFIKEDQEVMKLLERFFGQMCLDCLDYYDQQRGSGYLFCANLKSKLAARQLFGVEPDLVKKHKTRLVQDHCIDDLLKRSLDLSHFLEEISGSSFTVQSISFDAEIKLLYGAALRRLSREELGIFDGQIAVSRRTTDSCGQEMSTVPTASTSTSSLQSSGDETTRGATFYFRKEDKEAVKPLENLIRLMCLDCFVIPEEDVRFDYTVHRHGSGYPFYGDLKSKLAVIHLCGVERFLVKKHKTRLVYCIAGFLETRPDLIHFLEVTSS